MKAYITCPVSHSSKRLDLLPIIKEIVAESGIEPFVFIQGGTPEEIFLRDHSQLKSSNVLIAEVSERSHGVGIEIGLSFEMGLKRILLHQKGEFITKLAQGMPDTKILEYASEEDLKNKLREALKEYEK